MKKLAKVSGWAVTGLLVLAIAGLAFIKFVPGYSFSVVRSGSMVPTINVGDVIVTRPAGQNIQPGTVLMYQKGNDTITHRMLSVTGNNMVTKGDALQHPDPWQTPVSDVRGIYLFKIPLIGYVLSFVKTKTGWFLAIIVPAAVLVGWLCWDILKESFRDEAKPANRTSISSGEAKDA